MTNDTTPPKNPRFPGPAGGSGSAPISELGPRVRRTYTVSPENDAWVIAQGGKMSATVNAVIDAARLAEKG